MSKEKLINAIAKRRAQVGNKKIPKFGLVPREPKQPEREYEKALTDYVQVFINMMNDILVPQLDNLYNQAVALRPDSRADDWSNDLERLLDATMLSFERRAPNPRDLSNTAAGEVNEFNKKDFNRVMQSAFGVNVVASEPWLRPQIASFTNQNVQLIKNISNDAATQIEGIVQRGFATGAGVGNIKEQIEQRYAITKRRSQLIARDQVSKLNGQLTEYRHKEVGIERYRWVTAGDERVRSSHAELNNKIFSYNNPPSVGNPGQPVQCRCVAQPLIEGFDE